MHRATRASRGARACAFGLAFAAIALAPAVARAGVDGDVRAGYYTDSEVGFFGGGLISSMGRGSHWFFNPNIEVAPSSGVDLFSMNADFHYDFASTSGATWWAGGGPAVLVMHDEDAGTDDSDTDIGLNVLMGVGALGGEVRPFAQLKGVLADDSQLALTGGIRF
jgi:hypothetical protein